MQLRPYQNEAVAAIRREWADGQGKTLLVLPTGCGKTIVFCSVIEEEAKVGNRGLVLAHREELLDQAADKLERVTGMQCAREKAADTADGSWYRVTVGSVQTLMRQDRLARFRPDHYDYIIVDEAHHALSESYQRIFEYFSAAKVLGVTATPDRGDKRNLGEFFGSIAYEYHLPQAIKDGYLCKILAQTIPLEIDISNVSTRAGDFRLEDIGGALAPYLDKIADELKSHAGDRKSVVFLPLISTSQAFARMLSARGMDVREVNGESQDRKETLEWFNKAGPGSVLCNSMLLTEGWDEPSADCIVCLRPTKIRSLYAQIVGRGTRLHPGKENLLLLDFLWHTDRLELCRPAHLVTDNQETARRVTQILAEEGNAAGMDLEMAAAAGESSMVAEREQALAKKLEEMKHKKRTLVDPLQFEYSIQSADLAGYEPSMPAEMAPPTQKQIDALEKFGIFPSEIECQGKASLLIDRLNKRRQEGLSPPRQIRFLESKGFQHVGTWKFEQAKKLVDRIACNSWRVPYDINPQSYAPPASGGEEWRGIA